MWVKIREISVCRLEDPSATAPYGVSDAPGSPDGLISCLRAKYSDATFWGASATRPSAVGDAPSRFTFADLFSLLFRGLQFSSGPSLNLE
ncbi:hypothetical protein HanHA300_Chr16g0591181 [Helianthus annuus]|nr:hypothetical protein HanHA300_Chr16g0591181 [Helianthus annuus]KAJ0458750.1 hypothetical protein HanHA89_Chr16g0641331 [Helianthus annuus]